MAKVLANRLNKVNTHIIHPDQAGVLLNMSTSNNIGQAYLSRQVPAPEHSVCSFMALDAIKAFDSVEWPYVWAVLWSWMHLLYTAPRASFKGSSLQYSSFILC